MMRTGLEKGPELMPDCDRLYMEEVLESHRGESRSCQPQWYIRQRQLLSKRPLSAGAEGKEETAKELAFWGVDVTITHWTTA